ncbi:MAG: DUF3793 family protein [Eubacteriales bacterium]|nr:DUF3793 family protein [Eubacteriales bacterium]
MLSEYELEKYLICNCAPTLASLKSANLFNMPFDTEEHLQEQLDRWNACMEKKGISIYLLRKHHRKALIYVCRKSRLQENLGKPGVASFLEEYGYRNLEIDVVLQRLSQRMKAQEEFPHEIGIFLDYPLGDVIGFIRNAGQNYKCTGCWKVYCDECAAKKLFASYRKCQEIYQRQWSGGRSILQLTVAA